MADILSKLNTDELILMHKVESITGTIETRQELLEEQNIPNSYNSIFKRYSLLNDSEALKRALFIQWYASCEPTAFSGIGLLDESHQKKNLLTLTDALMNNKADSELKAMVKHYYAVADYYFNAFIDCSVWERHLTGDKVIVTSTINRGQMGLYWKSLMQLNR
jgi:hypothetical protein